MLSLKLVFLLGLMLAVFTNTPTDGQETTTNVAIGSTKCFTQSECDRIGHSMCKEGICQCLETHVPDLNHSRCLKIASAYNDPCEVNKQCPRGSHCIRKICTTEDGKGAATSAVHSLLVSVLWVSGLIFLWW